MAAFQTHRAAHPPADRFLPPVASQTDTPLFTDAFGFGDLSNLSHTSSDLLTTTDNSGIIIDGAGAVKTESQAEVVASFSVAQGETCAFDFDIFTDMASKEIEGAWLAELAASGNALDTAPSVQLLFEDGASLSLLGSDLTLSSLTGSNFEFL